MTPQERQLIDDLFDRLAKLENAPRDSEAMSAIMQGLRSAPNAVYALVQTALVQDEALKRAHDRIQELEAAVGQQQPAQQAQVMRMLRKLFEHAFAQGAHLGDGEALRGGGAVLDEPVVQGALDAHADWREGPQGIVEVKQQGVGAARSHGLCSQIKHIVRAW